MVQTPRRISMMRANWRAHMFVVARMVDGEGLVSGKTFLTLTFFLDIRRLLCRISGG
jgi:hypothetical protein